MVFIQTIEDLNNITENDIKLIFSPYFNQKVIIPQFIQILKLGDKFNQEIIIPNSVQILKFGENFNQKIIIPKTVNTFYYSYYNYSNNFTILNSNHLQYKHDALIDYYNNTIIVS